MLKSNLSKWKMRQAVEYAITVGLVNDSGSVISEIEIYRQSNISQFIVFDRITDLEEKYYGLIKLHEITNPLLFELVSGTVDRLRLWTSLVGTPGEDD